MIYGFAGVADVVIGFRQLDEALFAVPSPGIRQCVAKVVEVFRARAELYRPTTPAMGLEALA